MNRISDERLSVAEAEAAIRAASITPPAPERSKEEVKALEIAKRWAIWIDDASAGEEDEGGYLRAAFEADKATLLSAISQAQSALAAMRAERDALARHSLKAGNDAARMAIEVLRLTEDNEALRKERGRCHARLEIDHVWVMGDNDDSDLERRDIPLAERGEIPDGIECRDATIAVLEQDASAGKARIKALEEALGNMRCPRPCNHRPDEFDAKDCVAAGECGCGAHTLNSRENKE
jgi:hypothetical protein